MLGTPICLASTDDVNGVIGESTLGWNVSHGYPQAEKDQESLQKKVPAMLAKHQYAALDSLADTLRASKAKYPNGHDALYTFYNQIELPRTAPDQDWTNRLNDLNQWQTQYPDSKVAPAALVAYWVSFAWKARGSGYSNTVKEQGWKNFADRLANGHAVLDKARAKKDACPFLYVQGQVVALGESWKRPEYDKLFEEAIKRFPDSNEFYFQKVYNLQPRWDGGETEWPDFAAKAADKIGGANGDKLYARIAWYISNLGFYDNMFTEFPNLKWSRIDQGMQALLKEYPNSANVQNEYLKLAIQAGKTALSKQLLAKIGKNVDVAIWKRKADFLKVRATILQGK